MVGLIADPIGNRDEDRTTYEYFVPLSEFHDGCSEKPPSSAVQCLALGFQKWVQHVREGEACFPSLSTTASSAAQAAFTLHAGRINSTLASLPRPPLFFPDSTHPKRQRFAQTPSKCLELDGSTISCVIHCYSYILSRFRGAQRTIESTRSRSSAASAADETTARLSL